MSRNETVGASEVAALFGCHPYESAYSLWAKKCGLTEEQPETTRLRWGKDLERAILETWGRREGFNVTHNTTSETDDGQPRLSATPDAQLYKTIDGELFCALGEVKTVHPAKRAEWLNGVPEWYRLQVQAQLAVWDYDRAIVIPLFGFEELTHTVIDRDDDTIARIRYRVTEFWKRVTGELPPPEPDDHPSTLATLMQAKRDAEKSVSLDDTIAALDAELVAMTKRKTALEKDIRGAKAKILKAMGDATIGVLPDGTSWRVSMINVKARSSDAYSYQKLSRIKGGESVDDESE